MNQDWKTLRATALQSFGGDPPGAQLEQELIDAYAEHPAAVERSVSKITAAYQAGKIQSPWGALRAETRRAVTALANVDGAKAGDREKAIARAEQWLRAAGIHYDRATEIEDELFDSPGTPLLGAWAKDIVLRKRITDLWSELRPIGEQLEQDAIDRGLRYQQQTTT